MSIITLVGPQTAASSQMTLPTASYDSVVLHADGLSGSEEVTVFILGGKQRVAYPGTAAQAKLTATASAITLPPGPTYSIDKPATAATCGVYASVAPRDQ